MQQAAAATEIRQSQTCMISGFWRLENPVALDQACVDLIYMADGTEDFITRMEDRNAEYALEYAEQLGLGSSAYTLVTID